MGPRFRPYNYFLLRAPRLPSSIIEEMNGLGSKVEVWNFVREFLKDPQFLDAIYLASDTLFEQAVSRAHEEYGPEKDRLLLTLYKYVNRMSGRSTPLGKFAGIALGEIGEASTHLQLSGLFDISLRLDMEFVNYLEELMLLDKSMQTELCYYTNNTVYETSEKYHYIDFKDTGNTRRYSWARVSNNPLLKLVLDESRMGIQFSKLVEHLSGLGISVQDASRYISELIEAKLLISELESFSYKTDHHQLMKRLRTVDEKTLPQSLRDSLKIFLKDSELLTASKFTFTSAKEFRSIKQGTVNNIFQVDLRLGMAHNRINSSVINTLSKELEELSVISNVRRPPELESFCRKFLVRYGDREIPLLEVIDHERGVGYGPNSSFSAEHTPLLRNLGMPRKKDKRKSIEHIGREIIRRHWNSTERLAAHIELDERDLEDLSIEKGNRENLPSGFYVLGNLLKKDNEPGRDEFCFNLLSAGGFSAIPLMARFSYLDSNLEENLRQCAEWEENQRPESIIAEIGYLPKGRAGNILARPSFFKYEIPIVGKGNVKEDFIISLDDLLVSVNNGKVILRSKRLNKQVIPRLSSAHNFHHGMVVYRFLCDLQSQYGALNFGWDWGEMSSLPFTPRVSYKHIILSRAKWRIPKIGRPAKGSVASKIISSLQEKYNIPRVVSLTEGDNELVIDLRSPVGIEVLFKRLLKEDAVLQEYLFSEYSSPLTGTLAEPYNNEVIVPFKVEGNLKEEFLKPIFEPSVKRSFPPGSEWAFIKIYSGLMDAERLLRDKIPHLILELKKEAIIDKWFFIRYNDPDQHIRLRFLLNEANGPMPFQRLASLINKHLDPLLQSGQVYRVAYDTYERELERYGEGNMEICETIFQVDSEEILALLSLLKEDPGYLRWLSGMLGVDHLLAAFGLELSEKISLVTELRNAFMNEFSNYSNLKYKLDTTYRENRSHIEQFFSGLDYEPIHSILDNRLDAIKKLVFSLYSENNDKSVALDLLPSLSHMFINRLFFSRQREHEMIIYYLLVKQYTSIFNREKKRRVPVSI